MPETIKTRTGRVLVLPTEEEDARITAAAMADPDARPLTDEEFARARLAHERNKGGRPKSENPKVFTSIRLDADLLNTFKATGKGWQTRVNAALRKYLQEHPISA
jgi:uncharacterized protein (DUF4415 family)